MSIGAKLVGLTQKSALVRKAFQISEATIFGTGIRRSFAAALLDQYHRSEFRRKWIWLVDGEPRFEDHTDTLWRAYRGDLGQGIYRFEPAFNAARVIKEGDAVLDIGCGDGGLTKRFFAPRASRVVAIDIEPSAIAEARRKNSAPNIEYTLSDAVNEPFPPGMFNIIILDGALGHISKDDSDKLLSKIKSALAPGGYFCGSESVGLQDHDHLQIFDSEKDLADLLSPHFSNVEVLTSVYRISKHHVRHEASWTCRV